MNLILFIIGNVVHVIWKWRDYEITKVFAAEKMALGITEENGWFRGKDRTVSFGKYWIAVGIWHAIAWVLYLVPAASNMPDGSMEFWHPLYSLGVFALSCGASVIAYFHNKKKIEYRRSRLG